MGRGGLAIERHARVVVIRRPACLHCPTLACGWARKASSYHRTDGNTQAQFNGRGEVGRGEQAGGRDRTDGEEG